MTEETRRAMPGIAIGRRQLLGAGAAIVLTPAVVAVAAGAPSNQAATPDASPAATPEGTPSAGSVTLEAFDLGFDPTELTLAVGATLTLYSTGELPHNFIIEGYEDEVEVDFPEDGSDTEWTVPDDLAPGTYTFYCGIGQHRQAGMEGTLTIEEPAAASSSAASQTVEAFEFGFEPSTLAVGVGDTVSLFSTGEVPHNFVIEGYEDEAVDFPQDGSTVDWTVPETIEPGTYTFYCSIGNHRAQGMVGEITVE